MTFHTIMRHGRLALRGEALLLEARAHVLARRVLLLAVALLFAGIGIVFLNISVFAWLGPLWGPVWTPAGLALLNAALAVMALLLAALARPGQDVALAREIRDAAQQSFETEIGAGSLLGLAGAGIERGQLGGLLLPAITLIVKALSRRQPPAAS